MGRFTFQEYPEIKYFTFAELTKTDTGLPNKPHSFYVVCNLLHTAETLDLMREYIGQPLYINSCYRSSEVNEKVGGVPTSFHLYGLAADCWAIDNSLLEECIIEFKQLGYIDSYIKYPDNLETKKKGWFHVQFTE